MYEYRKPFCNGLAFTSFIYQTCCIKKQISYILFQFVCVYETYKIHRRPLFVEPLGFSLFLALDCVLFHKGKAKKPPILDSVFFIIFYVF